MSIVSLQLVRTWGSITPDGIPLTLQNGKLKQKTRANSLSRDFLGRSSDVGIGRSFLGNVWATELWHHVRTEPVGHSSSLRTASLEARASTLAVAEQARTIAISSAKAVGLACTRRIATLQKDPIVGQCAPALALIAFSLWGLGPTMCFLRNFVKKEEDVKWFSSRTYHVMSSYIRPVFLWIGVIVICRAVDPVVLPSAASHAVKERFLNFVRSLSTVLAFAFCTSSLTQQIQKSMMERQDKETDRSLGTQFLGNTVYTSVWIAAVCLFMELLGFSTQRLITAGGFGTVLLTLAGREIFTNFLSSVMIQATRPFVENEWIQTKIEGQQVSGTVEHVGWWSPTVIRGDDREAVHIPNHKFTVSVVRNLSQKTHWRIKTHFGISHLDVGKVSDIVSGMRKVMSHHPHVEQKKLHRRAFFDNVDPENQSLLILVSCFVKTPHFEEYLRVKELILLDMLRVISHHNARLATPIRSVQRVFDESETRQSPFREDPTTGRKRPLYTIEASAVSVKDSDEGEVIKGTSDTVKEITAKDIGKDDSIREIGKENGVKITNMKGTPSEDASKPKSKTKSKESAQVMAETSPKSGADTVTNTKPQLEGLDSMGLNANDITLLKAAFEKPPTNIPERPVDSVPHGDVSQSEKVKAVAKTATEQQKRSKADSSSLNITHETAEDPPSSKSAEESVTGKPLNDDPWRVVPQPSTTASGPQNSESGQSVARSLEEKVQIAQQAQVPASAVPVPRRQSVDENLVLGVALDGPKRTLRLDDEIPPAANKPRKLVTSRNGGGSSPPKDGRDPSSAPQPSPPGSSPESRGDRER